MKSLPGFRKLIILYIESGNNRISREVRLVYLVTLCSFENFKPDEHKRDDKLEIKVQKSTFTYGERCRTSNLFFQYMAGNWPSSGHWGTAGQPAMAGGDIV